MTTPAKTGYAAPAPRAGEFSDVRIGLLATQWNLPVVDRLVQGARECLAAWAVGAVDEQRAPGAYELPLAAARMLDTGRYDAVIALGAVIRGDTPHFDFVAGECARGLMDVQLRYGKPVAFGVLTVNNDAQAIERAQPGPANKGYEAAAAVLDMIRLIRKLAAGAAP